LGNALLAQRNYISGLVDLPVTYVMQDTGEALLAGEYLAKLLLAGANDQLSASPDERAANQIRLVEHQGG
jgi:hypothetical protein